MPYHQGIRPEGDQLSEYDKDSSDSELDDVRSCGGEKSPWSNAKQRTRFSFCCAYKKNGTDGKDIYKGCAFGIT